jgi:hypothetical protein
MQGSTRFDERLKPPPVATWPIVAAAWVWLPFAVVYLTDAACPIHVEILLFLTGATLAVAWLILTAWSFTYFRKALPFGWFSVPLIGAFAMTVGSTDFGFTARVVLSETALQRYVESLPPGDMTDRTPQSVGLFHVHETEKYDGAVYLYTSSGLLNQNGVAYKPPGSQPAPRMRVWHLYGPWYSFEWRF